MPRCRDFIERLQTVQRMEILPRRPRVFGKRKAPGFTYPSDGVPTPTIAQVCRAEELPA